MTIGRSGKIEYQGRLWDEDDPLKPPGLTNQLREEGVRREMEAKDHEEPSVAWKVLGVVASGIQLTGTAVKTVSTAANYLAGANELAQRASSSQPSPQQDEIDTAQAESSGGGSFWSLLTASTSTTDPRWRQAEEMRKKAFRTEREATDRIDDSLEALKKGRIFESGRQFSEAWKKKGEGMKGHTEANRLEQEAVQDLYKKNPPSERCLIM